MRAPVVILVAVLVVPTVASEAFAVAPLGMSFNGKPSGDVKGPVTSVSVDGLGKWGAASLLDSNNLLVSVPEDVDLTAFNLQSQSPAWSAADNDALNEGADLVRMAKGNPGQEGGWLAIVNHTTAPTLVSIYQARGFGAQGQQGALTWQYDTGAEKINGMDIDNSGDLLGIATGATGQNKSFVLLRNRLLSSPPLVLYRMHINFTDAPDVSRFTSVALSSNSSVPASPDIKASVYSVVGAEIVSSNQVLTGRIYIFETVFNPSLDAPTTTTRLTINTESPVTSVAMTQDGEYALAGTQQGQLYLLSVSGALQRQGLASSSLDPQLSPWQQSLGSQVTALALNRAGGKFFAAGTSDGTIALFYNLRNAQGSQGAQAADLAPGQPQSTGNLECSPQLSGAVTSMAIGASGDQLVVGAKDGVLAYEVASYAASGGGPLAPAWCQGYSGDDVKNGVYVDVTAKGEKVLAGTGHRVYGYTNFYCEKIEASPSTLRTGAPGERVQWSVTVRNEGSAFDRFNLSLVGPTDAGWHSSISNTSLALMPGKSQTVILNVTSPESLAPNNVSLTFAAIPERATAATADRLCTGHTSSLPLILNIGSLRRVEVVPPTGILVASAGTINKYVVKVRNLGNNQDRFRVTAGVPEPQANFASPGSNWVTRVDPAEIEVPAGGEVSVDLGVTPQAQRGDSATIQVTAEGSVANPDGSTPSDTKQLQVAVEPTFNGDIGLAETKDYRAEPGQTVYVNYTVRNLGNSRDVFTVKNRTEPVNEPGFRLQLSDERFELRTQNAVKVIRLSVFIQSGVEPGRSARILVDLFSGGLQQETRGSDGLVDSQAVVVTVVPHVRQGVPGLGEPLMVLGVMAAAFAARGRRRA